MKFLAVFLCLIGLGCGMTPEYVKKFVSENKLRLISAAGSAVLNVSAECKEALNKTAAMDAVKYLDNTGKPASGLMSGNTQWLGNFDSCVKMESAQYCFSQVSVKINKNWVKISWGLCVPKECSETDVGNGLEDIVNELQALASKYVKIPFMYVNPMGEDRYVACSKKSEYSAGAIITLTIIAIFLLLCATGTCYDLLESFMFVHNSHDDSSTTNGELIVRQPKNGFTPQINSSADDAVLLTSSDVVSPSVQVTTPHKQNLLRTILSSFSLIKNTDQIMNTKAPSNSITCINGIRVISMFWVILGHTFLFLMISGTTDNMLTAYQMVQTFMFMAVDNAMVSVDSFFFLSGLLVGYLGWRKMDKNHGYLPIFGFYFHRFLRLTPGLMFVILFFDKMMTFLGEGPVWFGMQTETACDKYWWTNLLYINNFYPNSLTDECIGWSWYLANDMQFYVISPLILIAVYKWKWIGAALTMGSMTVISIIVTIAIMAHYDLSALGFTAAAAAHPEKSTQYSDYVYIKPYCRIIPYLVGMLIGYLFHRKINIFSRLPRTFAWIINAAGWAVAAIVALLIVYGPYSEYKAGGKPFNKAENLLYGGFFRLLWGICLAWVAYACHYGYGGQINRFLSAHYWIPLSRLTYGAYLLHPIVLMSLFISFETPVHFTMKLMIFYFISSTALSYGAAYILAIFIELPLANLEKHFFKL